MIQKERLVRFIRNGWWLVFLAIVAAVGSAFVAINMTTPLYQSSTRYVISPSRTTEPSNYGDMIYGIDALSRRATVATYVEIFQSERIVDSATSILGMPSEALEHYTVSAVGLPETSIIHLAVTGPNARMAQQLATTMGTEAVTYISDLYEVYEITLLDIAKVPQIPISPNVPRTVLMAALLGGMVGLFLAFIRTPEILSAQDYSLAPQPAQRQLTAQPMWQPERFPPERKTHPFTRPPQTSEADQPQSGDPFRYKVGMGPNPNAQQYDLITPKREE